jgi:hypothetical protein
VTVLVGAGAAAGGLAAFGGVALLRRAWRRERPGWPTLLGWTLLAAAIPGWALCARWDKAAALALLVPSLVGYGFVAANRERRPARARPAKAATELPERSGEAVWRGVARTLCAGPLAGAAAVLLAAAWGLKGPGSPPDRAALALLLAPLLWAAGLVWATTDASLLRIGGGLGALAALGAAAAAL